MIKAYSGNKRNTNVLNGMTEMTSDFEVTYTKYNGFERRSLSHPPILEKDDVLVKPLWVGICGSDLFAKRNIGDFILRFGHEWIGVILEVGSNVTELDVNDIVSSTTFISCGTCSYCALKKTNFCEHPIVLGSRTIGALRSWMILPKRSLIKVPSNLGEAAVLLEVAGVAGGTLELLEKIRLSGKKAIVLGAGPVGIFIALTLEQHGFEVVISENEESRVKRAKRLGLTALLANDLLENNVMHNSFDLVIDASGDQRGGDGAWGQIHLFGKNEFTGIIVAKYSGIKSIEIDRFAKGAARILWQRAMSQEAMAIATARWAGQIGSIADILVSHRFPVPEIETAFRTCADAALSGKVLIKVAEH